MNNFDPISMFLGATKHLYNWLCLSVGLSVCRLVTHSFDDPHVAPYWPTWPCSLYFFLSFHFSLLDSISTAPYHVEKRLSVHPQAFILSICLFLELGKWERNARGKKKKKKKRYFDSTKTKPTTKFNPKIHSFMGQS